MKNTKTTKKNNGSKVSTVANNSVLSPRQQTARKNNSVLGKPLGSRSNGLVSLETLVKSLPANAQIPVSFRYLRELNITADAPFISTTNNLKAITKMYSKVVPVVNETVLESETTKEPQTVIA